VAESNPAVSVIILNYNGLDFLPRCMESLRKTSYSPLEIIVVDNNSTDTSLEYLREYHPDVRIIPILENLGYSGAYNVAVPLVDSKYIVLLNFDVEVEAEWLSQAIELLEADENLAAVQPKLKAYQNHRNFEYSGGSGGFIDAYGFPFVRGRVFDEIEEDNGQYEDAVPIFWATGAAFVTRKSDFEAVGGLDHDFFMHMEELDLCWRYWLTGREIRVAPRGTVYHFAGAALSADSYRKMYYNHRNSLAMMMKNYERANLLKRLPIRFLLDWITILISPLRGENNRTFAVLAAHWYIFTHLPSIRRKRRKVQQMRTVSDIELNHVIMPFCLVWRYYLKKQKVFSDLAVNR
jgi:GT2 family glycosyltransferase